jgi:hypothetical protein
MYFHDKHGFSNAGMSGHRQQQLVFFAATYGGESIP